MTSQRSAGLMGPGGVLFAAALTLGAIALSWLSLSHAMAEAQADADPAAALHWRGHNARALAAASEQKLQSLDGGVAEAAALARAALRYGPLQSTPLRTLALAAVRQKQEAAAQRFMAQAALRTRRDPLAQSWLLERAHARGDYAQTIVRADAIMRLDAEMTASLFALINDVAARPGGEAPVAASLAARPPWRADYLRQLVAQPGGGARAWALHRELIARGAGPSDAEAQPLLARMIADGDFALAAQAWSALLPHDQRAPAGRLYDGAFQGKPGVGPFNWETTPRAALVAEIARAPDGSPALHVAYPSGALAALAGQLLLLEPGTWRLSGRVRFEPLATPGELAWNIWCVEGDKQLIAETRQTGDVESWRAFETTFEVPPADCRAQWLGLRSFAQDSFSNVEAWYGGLKLERAG